MSDLQTIDANQGASLLAIIKRVATSNDIDLAKMQMLLDTQTQIMGKQAQMAFDAAHANMQGELPTVLRGKTNSHTRSKYSALEDINQAVQPVLKRHGFSVAFKLAQNEKTVTVTAELKHRDGHRESTAVTLPLDNGGLKGNTNKTDVQAIGSTITYARRYALCALLNISTGDNDGNAAHAKDEPEPEISNEARAELKALVAQMSPERKQDFYEKYDAVENVTAREFNKVLKAVKGYVAEFKKESAE